MRYLLSCLTLALFAGVIGCGEPAAPETKPMEKPAATDGDAGSDAKKEEGSGAKKEEGSGTSATTEASDNMQMVSLNLPHMS